MTDVVIVGPGRAGLSLASALDGAGHRIVGVMGRRPDLSLPWLVLPPGGPLPATDVVLIAVRDDDIEGVAERLSTTGTPLVAHVSGATSLTALESVRARGCPVGSFHPLQTLPNPDRGARALAGCWIAVTAADEQVERTLVDLATSIGAHPFRLKDADKPTYHAGAAAAANYVVAALAVAHRMFETAGVPWRAAEPLVGAIVENAFELGPAAALTGPIARGDVGTVEAQRRAAAAAGVESEFVAFGRITARLAGTAETMGEVLG